MITPRKKCHLQVNIQHPPLLDKAQTDECVLKVRHSLTWCFCSIRPAPHLAVLLPFLYAGSSGPWRHPSWQRFTCNLFHVTDIQCEIRRLGWTSQNGFFTVSHPAGSLLAQTWACLPFQLFPTVGSCSQAATISVTGKLPHNIRDKSHLHCTKGKIMQRCVKWIVFVYHPTRTVHEN